MLDSATAASLSSSTSHDSFIIVVTAPFPLHPCKFKTKYVESEYSIEFESRGCLLLSVGLCVGDPRLDIVALFKS
ncbi:hypothetical protein HN873_007982 [Arachis hypogaea]|nr:uncharacterized protein DS421_3g77540 [Arachis hypogaea]